MQSIIPVWATNDIGKDEILLFVFLGKGFYDGKHTPKVSSISCYALGIFV